MSQSSVAPVRLPIVGQASITPTPAARNLVATELGAFRYDSVHERHLVRKLGSCIADYKLIEANDRIMVCISGGKDSYALLDLLLMLQRKSPVKFTLVAANVDQGWPGYETDVIEAHIKSRGVEYRMVKAHEIAEVVERVVRPEETGATPCSMCSRLRRGVLYGLQKEIGATKIALGHHLDDLAETLLMNLFFTGSLRTMPPRLVSDNGEHVVIRPLAYVEENQLASYAEARKYPVVRCSCPTCGLPEQQRQQTKRMIDNMSKQHPGLRSQMLAAMKNIRPNQLLDSRLYT